LNSVLKITFCKFQDNAVISAVKAPSEVVYWKLFKKW